MKILISGGTGFVGQALVQSLVAANHACQVLSRTPDRYPALGKHAAMGSWDSRSEEGLPELMNEADAVVQLAGESIGAGRWTAGRKRRILDSRVVSSAALAKAALASQNPPRVFVQASAVGYYGPCGEEEVTEDAPPGADFLADVCRQWEAASASLDDSAIRRVVVRTGVVLSPSGGALPRMAAPFKFFVGGPAGTGSQWMSWIHLVDEITALRFLLEDETAKGVFNLTAPKPVTNRDFSRALGKALNRPSAMPAPAVGLRLALGEMADLILTGQRAIPRHLLDAGYTFRFPNLASAFEDIY